MDNTSNTPPLYGLSLFTGIGGIELGLQAALGRRYITKCYVEREVAAIAILLERMREERLHQGPIWTDVQSFDCTAWRGHIDIISAGIPCQPWSAAGKRQGHDDERHMWDPTRRIIDEIRPSYVFIENVPGLIGKGLEPIWRDLRAMGYEVEAGIFSAAEVGAKHIRKRLFILAHSLCKHIRQQQYRTGEGPGHTPVLTDGHGSQGDVAHTDTVRKLQSQGVQSDKRRRPSDGSKQYNPWEIEPNVGRVADGIPNRVDRLRALGNAVVPQAAAHAFTTLLQQAHS